MVPATNTRLYMDDGDIPGHLEGRLPNLSWSGQDYWLQLSVCLSSQVGVLVGRAQMFLYFTGDKTPHHTPPSEKTQYFSIFLILDFPQWMLWDAMINRVNMTECQESSELTWSLMFAGLCGEWVGRRRYRITTLLSPAWPGLAGCQISSEWNLYVKARARQQGSQAGYRNYYWIIILSSINRQSPPTTGGQGRYCTVPS